jgi:Skp family chaperone for outer membrane proteins
MQPLQAANADLQTEIVALKAKNTEMEQTLRAVRDELRSTKVEAYGYQFMVNRQVALVRQANEERFQRMRDAHAAEIKALVEAYEEWDAEHKRDIGTST